MDRIEIHPLAALFPLLEGAAFDAMVEDIRVNGLQNPIVTLDGAVVDGRNRLAACRHAGVEPRFVEYDGDPARLLRWMASTNLHRRHLTPSQRALIAAEIAMRLAGPDAPVRPVLRETTETLGVTLRHAQYAQTVLSRGVEKLATLVRQGEISVYAADKVARRPIEEQRALAEGGAEAIDAWLGDVGWSAPRLATDARGDESAKPPPPHPAAKVFTPSGNRLSETDFAELESVRRQARDLLRLVDALAALPQPAGRIGDVLPPEEFERRRRESRA